MALAPIVEAFRWGAGGQKLTEEQIAREREIAALLGEVDTSPIADPMQGWARVANAVTGRIREGRANRAEQENATYNQDIISGLLGSMGGGATGGYAGGNPVAAALTGGMGGAPVDPASARVAQAHGVPAGERADYIRQGLVQRGLPEHVADAFLVNFQDESGLDPNINERNPLVPGSRGGFGLYQLTGPRRREYEAFAGQRGSGLGDIDAQLDFMMGELQGSEARAAQSILGAPDTASAAQAIVSDFLRPAPEHRQSRMSRYAQLGGAPQNAAAATEAMATGQMPPQMSAFAGPEATSLSSMPVNADMPMAGAGGFSPVAQALSQPQQPVQTAQAGGINPAIIGALSDPRASGGTRQIAQLLLGQQFSQQQAEQERIRAEQEAQLQMQQRMQAAQAAGVDPRFIGDDEIWKAATGAQFREQPTDIREYEYARGQGYEGSFAQFQQDQKRAGATNITNNVGGEGLSPGQKKIDEAFADTYLDWNAGGFADSIKQLDQLDEALRILESGENITGAIGALPAQVAPFINPNGTIARENIEEVVQRSLREILGAQFTEKEGERLISRAFNPLMSPQENAKRVRRLMTTIGSMADAKQDMVDYFDENGTLRGYKGSRPTPSQIERLASEFGASPDEDRGNRTSSGVEWSIEE